MKITGVRPPVVLAFSLLIATGTASGCPKGCDPKDAELLIDLAFSEFDLAVDVANNSSHTYKITCKTIASASTVYEGLPEAFTCPVIEGAVTLAAYTLENVLLVQGECPPNGGLTNTRRLRKPGVTLTGPDDAHLTFTCHGF